MSHKWNDFCPGDRVRVRLGDKEYTGTVVHRRYAPPDFMNAAAYSVRLDDVTRPNYSGTTVAAMDVRAEVA